MGPLVGATELSKALLEAGNNLLKPHSSTDAILSLLDEIESLLSTVEQDPIAAVNNALIPSMNALVSAELLRNPDSDVRVFVVSCLTEIMRITAPEAPYNDDQMKEIFEVTVEAFGKLQDATSRSYRKAEAVLDTVSKVRSSLVMLDLECDDLILAMFRQFLKIISPLHPQPVILSMENIMITVIDESEEVSMDLLELLLTTVKKGRRDVTPIALELVEKVLSSCACKLQPCIMEALKSTGTSLDMYSPVVLSICQSEAATTEAQIEVNPKETEADEKISEEKVPSDSLQEKLDLRISGKGSRSKRTARGGTRANGDDTVTNGNDLKQLLKQGQSSSTDAETESGFTKRGRKPNSLMNPEEGYSFKTSSSKKVQEKELGDSSLGKLAAKKASLPSKVGQTNQSVVISLSPSSKARKGSRKRSRSKMDDTNLDADSLATPASKKQVVKKVRIEEEDFMESDLEKPEDNIKTAKSSKKERADNGLAKTSAKKLLAESNKESAKNGLAKTSAKKPLAESKKERAHNGLAKTSAKKPLAESKTVKTSGKKSLHSDVKKKNSEGAGTDTPIPQSSKSKKKNSHATTPSAKESEQTPKSQSKRKRTPGEEVESNKSEFGEELVGKRVNVWWPLDKKFYEGVIDSYDSRKKTHKVCYSDGDAENLNLKKERWEILQDNSSASEDEEIDLPDSTPLSDLIRRQRANKSKHRNVEMSSSPDVGSSMGATKKKNSVTNSTKQAKKNKGALKRAVSNEKRQKAARAMHRESEKDCDEKEEAETKGEDGLKFGKESDAEPECKRDHHELSEDPIAEIETDGEELKSTNKPDAELETEQEVAKEPTAEPKTDGEEHKSVREPSAVPETEVQERESAEEPTADTTLIEKEAMSEENESDRDAYTSVPETGRVENEAEEDDDQRVTKELEGETHKAEVGTTTSVSG
ncbi:unnamed protein product [Thlaspi arvense]|uniref:Uncharacterized protein n=1 Tax=Thlaspi arvense TaxID=13288 RepID=A0AAU9RDV1_THLAR|nr:unnamed protein product [Thlaspi arvense]